MDDTMREAAIEAGRASFLATTGSVSPRYELLARHAPDTFAGYCMMRAALMRDVADGAALPLATKELIFAALDAVVAQADGCRIHACNAIRAGATLAQLAEAMTQAIMVGGITAWNLAGAQAMEAAEALAAADRDAGARGQP
ncbi:MAG: carboxymuconolactone decarboxylase family protein [Acetobacteraceae bacterium]|nr:carboxymuconolactone decarboxylase family protein [Acetobacteraceae bacterium]